MDVLGTPCGRVEVMEDPLEGRGGYVGKLAQLERETGAFFATKNIK